LLNTVILGDFEPLQFSTFSGVGLFVFARLPTGKLGKIYNRDIRANPATFLPEISYRSVLLEYCVLNMA